MVNVQVSKKRLKYVRVEGEAADGSYPLPEEALIVLYLIQSVSLEVYHLNNLCLRATH